MPVRLRTGVAATARPCWTGSSRNQSGPGSGPCKAGHFRKTSRPWPCRNLGGFAGWGAAAVWVGWTGSGVTWSCWRGAAPWSGD